MLYAVDEKVLCFHGPLIYQAKVLKAEKWTGDENTQGATGPHFFVHYDGWKKSWDEWVPESRLLKLNEENKAKQKALIEARKSKAAAAAAASDAGPSSSKAGAAGRRSGAGGGDVDGENGSRSKKESRGTKRGRDTVENEDEYVKRPEIKLVIPDALKLQLVDDWENVTKKGQLVPLPRKPSVGDLLEEYREYYMQGRKERSGRLPAVVDEVLSGLKLYFDKSLGNNLLYRFERAQYVEQRKRHASATVNGKPTAATGASNEAPVELEPSECYGAEHLLRLFVNLPGIIAHTTMDADSVSLLREHLSEFLGFMAKNQKRIFVQEYDHASPAYARSTHI